MKVDIYTKSILTVIALCLVYLCVHTRVDTVHAEGPMRVIVAGSEVAVPIAYAGVASRTDLPNAVISPLPVNGGRTYDGKPISVPVIMTAPIQLAR